MTKFVKNLSVPQVIVWAYVLFIVIGTFLLALPVASASGEWTPPLIDALFSSTAAVSVTGGHHL